MVRQAFPKIEKELDKNHRKFGRKKLFPGRIYFWFWRQGVYLRGDVKNSTMNRTVAFIFLYLFLQLIVFSGCKKNEGYTTTVDSLSSLPEITVNDIDGNLYHGVYIGSQIWMLENLKTTRFRDGTPIENITDQTLWTGMSDTLPAYCNYSNDNYLGSVYGKLYNRNVIYDSLPIAPSGWRIPTIADWDTLIAHLGGASVAGNKLREKGTDHWLGPNSSTNSSGFTALPGGFRTDAGFSNLSLKGKFWAYWPYLSYIIDGGQAVTCDSNTTKFSGLSIRCIKE
jgi:uncharacterized protein (TIGR02145 family)